MTDQFRSKLEEKKKEIDGYISKAKKQSTRDIFITLKGELEKIRTIQDLDARIAAAVKNKKQAKNDTMHVAFDVLEKELLGLKSSLPGEALASRGETPGKEELEDRIDMIKPHLPIATIEPVKAEKPKTLKKPEVKRAEKVTRHHRRQKKHRVTLRHIHHRISKMRRKTPKRISEADDRLEKMSSLVVKMPELRLGLEELEGRMKGHAEAVSELKTSEDDLHGSVKEVMDSLSGLRDHVVGKMARQKMEKEEADRMLEKTGEAINTKVNIMSRKLDEALEKLSSRIDETSKIGKLQMEGNIQFLRNQIEQMRNQMPERARKDKRRPKKKRLMREPPSKDAQPDEREIAEAAKHVKKPAEKPKGEATDENVQIADLKHFRGREVVLEVEPELIKSVEEGGTRMYGYNLKDESGEVMLTSTEEIKEPKARLKCMVNETAKGRIYLKLIERL